MKQEIIEAIEKSAGKHLQTISLLKDKIISFYLDRNKVYLVDRTKNHVTREMLFIRRLQLNEVNYIASQMKEVLNKKDCVEINVFKREVIVS